MGIHELLYSINALSLLELITCIKAAFYIELDATKRAPLTWLTLVRLRTAPELGFRDSKP
jgi:hypothetical protein